MPFHVIVIMWCLPSQQGIAHWQIAPLLTLVFVSQWGHDIVTKASITEANKPQWASVSVFNACTLVMLCNKISLTLLMKSPSAECHWPHRWLVNIGSSNGLVPSSSKPLPEPILTGSMPPYGVTRPQWVKLLFSLTHSSDWFIEYFFRNFC